MLEKVVNLVSTIVNTVTRDKRQVVAPPGADTAARDVTDAAKPNGSVDNETAVTLSSEGPLILGDTASGSLKPDAMGAVDNPLGGAGHRLDESEPVADIPTDTDAGLPSPGKETACAGETQPREPVTRSREESARQYDQYVRDNQISFFGLTTENTVGIPLDGENRWIKLYNQIPWEKFIPKYEEARKTQKEERTPAYKTRELAELLKDQQPEVAAIGEQLHWDFIDAALVKHSVEEPKKASKAGRKPIPPQRALAAIIAHGILDGPYREFEKTVSENPYLQYFLGYTEFSSENTVDFTHLCKIEEILNLDVMRELNEIIIAEKARYQEEEGGEKADPKSSGALDSAVMDSILSEEEAEESTAASSCNNQTEPSPLLKDFECLTGRIGPGNKGVLTIDATCGPVNIEYPQDFMLLNEARKDLDGIIDVLCAKHGHERPRTYRIVLQQEAASLSKDKRKDSKKIRKVIRRQLNAIVRNMDFIDGFVAQGDELERQEAQRCAVIKALYMQQKYMYDNKVTRVDNRIVSIDMPFIRPISRGKTNVPIEFGPKFDYSIDENGNVRVEHFSYSAYNEAGYLQEAIEAYLARTGFYPEKVLADQIYRNRENRAYCKARGITLSGPKLGRKPKDEEKKQQQIDGERQDMVERIKVERHFSRDKRIFGIGKIMERTSVNVGHHVGRAALLDNLVPVGF